MGLSKQKLTSGFLSLFGNSDGISGLPDVHTKWTNAYHSYAMDAEDVSGDRVVTTNRTGFLSSLSLGSGNSIFQAALNFDRAFVAYWTGGIFAVGALIVVPPAGCPNVGGSGVWSSEITSVVTVVSAGVLAGLLVPVFSSISDGDTARSKARQMATAFHQATISAVTVLITGLDTTPGPTGPLPITNTCTIR